MSALPAPDERSRSDSYSLALPEFADSELDRIDPDMTSPEVFASTHSESKRQLPVADLDAPSLPQAVETSKDDDPSASGEENKEKPSSIGQISQSPYEGPPADTVLDIGEVVGAPESTESQKIASSAYVEDVSDNVFEEAIPSISEQNPLASIHQETQPQSEENPTNYADKGEPESSELAKLAESPPGAVEETSALPGSIPDAEIIGQPVRKSPEPSNALPTEVQPTFLPAELPSVDAAASSEQPKMETSEVSMLATRTRKASPMRTVPSSEPPAQSVLPAPTPASVSSGALSASRPAKGKKEKKKAAA